MNRTLLQASATYKEGTIEYAADILKGRMNEKITQTSAQADTCTHRHTQIHKGIYAPNETFKLI